MTVAMGPGVLFGGYRIEAVAGRGGMGVVYRATDLSLARPVALKLIAPEFAQDPGFRERFLREPRLAASLDHPGLVPIYEAGERDGQLYLAMRWVEGSDLRRMLQRDGRLSPEVTVNVLTQIAAALDATHRRGVIHRDVKPANILVDDDGHAYLGDFGISGEAGAAGRIAGAPHSLAPAQIRGAGATAAPPARPLSRGAGFCTGAWAARRHSGAAPRAKRCGPPCGSPRLGC